jgi:hypothetical protein
VEFPIGTSVSRIIRFPRLRHNEFANEANEAGPPRQSGPRITSEWRQYSENWNFTSLDRVSGPATDTCPVGDSSGKWA